MEQTEEEKTGTSARNKSHNYSAAEMEGLQEIKRYGEKKQRTQMTYFMSQSKNGGNNK